MFAPQIEYNMCNRSSEDILGLCAQYGIKVVARNGTLGGLINEKYLGVESPDSLVDDPDLASVAECLDLVQRFGGWERFQVLLEALKSIGDKHNVRSFVISMIGCRACPCPEPGHEIAGLRAKRCLSLANGQGYLPVGSY